MARGLVPRCGDGSPNQPVQHGSEFAWLHLVLDRATRDKATRDWPRWLAPALLLCLLVAALWGSYRAPAEANVSSPASDVAVVMAMPSVELEGGEVGAPPGPLPCERAEETADDVEALPLLRSRIESGCRGVYRSRVGMTLPEHWPLRETPPPRA